MDSPPSIAAPDPKAAEKLIAEFHVRIFAFLRRLVGNDPDAEDLTQRTFTRAWASFHTFAGRSSASSWLHGIAHHVYLDWLKTPRRTQSQPDEWWAVQPAQGPSPADALESADLAGVVYAAVDRLEPDLRSTVHLHYYQGLTLQETAEALDTATSTVKYRLRNALDRLQSSLVHQPALARRIQTA